MELVDCDNQFFVFFRDPPSGGVVSLPGTGPEADETVEGNRTTNYSRNWINTEESDFCPEGNSDHSIDSEMARSFGRRPDRRQNRNDNESWAGRYEWRGEGKNSAVSALQEDVSDNVICICSWADTKDEATREPIADRRRNSQSSAGPSARIKHGKFRSWIYKRFFPRSGVRYGHYREPDSLHWKSSRMNSEIRRNFQLRFDSATTRAGFLGAHAQPVAKIEAISYMAET